MADRRGRNRPRAALPIGFLLALGLAACVSTPATPSATATTAPTSVPTVLATPSLAPPTASPTTAPTTVSGAPPCTALDLKASHGLVEGAAGSRLTSVVVVAASKCSVAAFPTFGLRDSKGAELVNSVAGGPGRIELDPNASYESPVRFANWCGTDPAFPLTLGLRVGAEEVAVTGSSFPDAGDMPPCNGAGGPELGAGAWEAGP